MYGITKSAVAVWMGTSILAVGSFGAEQDPLDRAMEDAQKIQKKIDKAQAKIAKNINMARKRLGKEFAQRREERREKFLRGLRKEAFGHTWHRARMELDTEKTLLLRERLEKLQQSSKYARYRQKLDRVEEKEYLTSLELVLGSYREEEGLFRAVLKHP